MLAFIPFGPMLLLTVPAAQHGLSTAALCLAVYDTSSPAARIRPGRVTVDPLTYEVQVAFGQAQSGTLVLGDGFALDAVYSQALSGLLSVVIPGAVHGLLGPLLLPAIYDAQGYLVEEGSLTIMPGSLDVTVTFGQGQSGWIVLAGHSTIAVTPTMETPYTTQTIWTVLASAHQLHPQAILPVLYDTHMPAALLESRTLRVHPTTGTVTVTWPTPMSGHLVLGGQFFGPPATLPAARDWPTQVAVPSSLRQVRVLL